MGGFIKSDFLMLEAGDQIVYRGGDKASDTTVYDQRRQQVIYSIGSRGFILSQIAESNGYGVVKKMHEHSYLYRTCIFVAKRHKEAYERGEDDAKRVEMHNSEQEG